MSRKIRARGTASRLVLYAVLAACAGMVSRAQGADSAKPAAVVRLSQLDSDIGSLRSRLASTVAALEDVKAAAANNADLATPYRNFSDSLAGLEGQVALLRERGTAAKARAKEHWSAWQMELTSMQNPKLREKAQSRYTATVKEFQKIVERVDAAKEVCGPLMADMKDVDTYLKTDLSKDAVSSLSRNIWNMSLKAKKADARLADVSEQINRTIKKMPQQ